VADCSFHKAKTLTAETYDQKMARITQQEESYRDMLEGHWN